MFRSDDEPFFVGKSKIKDKIALQCVTFGFSIGRITYNVKLNIGLVIKDSDFDT